jgi:hypothetical protein
MKKMIFLCFAMLCAGYTYSQNNHCHNNGFYGSDFHNQYYQNNNYGFYNGYYNNQPAIQLNFPRVQIRIPLPVRIPIPIPVIQSPNWNYYNNGQDGYYDQYGNYYQYRNSNVIIDNNLDNRQKVYYYDQNGNLRFYYK